MRLQNWVYCSVKLVESALFTAPSCPKMSSRAKRETSCSLTCAHTLLTVSKAVMSTSFLLNSPLAIWSFSTHRIVVTHQANVCPLFPTATTPVELRGKKVHLREKLPTRSTEHNALQQELAEVGISHLCASQKYSSCLNFTGSIKSF